MDLLNLKSLFERYQWRQEAIWMRNFNVIDEIEKKKSFVFVRFTRHFAFNFILICFNFPFFYWRGFSFLFGNFKGAFKLYDVDNDGFITRTEMYNIVDAIYQMVVSSFSFIYIYMWIVLF